MSLLCLAAIAGLSASVPPADGGEPASATTLVTLGAADACGFHRSEAFGRGITHYATEMLWACEAIADRRAAGMPLGDRLAVIEVALAAYREAVIAAGRRAFAERRGNTGMPKLTEAAKRDLAERSGALAALEAIQTGF